MPESNPVAATSSGPKTLIGAYVVTRYADPVWKDAKSKKGRVVPIETTRLRTLLQFLHIGGETEEKPDEAFVFTRATMRLSRASGLPGSLRAGGRSCRTCGFTICEANMLH